MGLEYKLYHKIIGFPSISAPRIKKAKKFGWDSVEAKEMDTFMVKGMLQIIEDGYSTKAVENLILSEKVLSTIYKKIKDKEVLLAQLDKCAQEEQEFSKHLEETSGKPLDFVILSTNYMHAVYCNEMLMPGSTEMNTKAINNLKFALRVSYKEIDNDANLDDYYSENEFFPKWLKELSFLRF